MGTEGTQSNTMYPT